MILLSLLETPLYWIYLVFCLLVVQRVYITLLIFQSHTPAQTIKTNVHWLVLSKRLSFPFGIIGTLIALSGQINSGELNTIIAGIGQMIHTSLVAFFMIIYATLLDSIEHHMCLRKETNYA
jgi:hypothetical protein